MSGVLRGILLVAVAFVVYSRVLTGSTVPVVDKSQSAKIFSSLEQRVNAEVPQDAPGWILARYQELVGDCGAPTSTAIDGGTGSATEGTGARNPHRPRELSGPEHFATPWMPPEPSGRIISR